MRIPSPLTTSVSRSTQPLIGPRAQPSPEAYGAGVGRALGGAAQQLSRVGEFVRQQEDQRKRFDALRRFSAFQTQVQEDMLQYQRSPEGQVSNFAEVYGERYASMEQDFLAEIDPTLQDEFSVRTAQFGQSVAGQALTYQYTANDTFFRDGVSEGYEAAKINLAQNNSPENFDAQLSTLFEQIDSSGLSAPEKTALKRQVQKGLSAILYKEMQLEHMRELDETGGAQPLAVDIIEQFGGATPDESEILAQQGEQIAASAVGSLDMWAALPTRVRAALTSLASDLGGLPAEVAAAARTGDVEEIEAAVRKLGGERRTSEADLIANPGAQIDDDLRFGELPYEDRLAIQEDAKRDLIALTNAENAAAAAQNAGLINALMVGLYDGTAGQADIDSLRELGVLTDIDDITKAQKLLEDRTGHLALVAAGQERLNAGQTFDPGNEDDMKILNAMLGDDGKASLRAMDSEYVTQQLVPLVSQGKDIPVDAVSTLVGMMRSNNQTAALWALDTLSQLQQASPAGYDHRTNDDVASAVELWRTRKDFYDPTTLLRLINGGMTQAERQETLALREEAQSILRDEKIDVWSGVVESFGSFGGVLGIGSGPAQLSMLPWAQREMQSDFDRLFEDQFTLYRNVEDAKAAAITLLKRSWSVSQVTGVPRLMKFSPETMYPTVANSHSWLTEQVRAEGLIPEEAGFDLLSDAQTAAEVDEYRRGGPPPSYVLMKIVDGQPSILYEPSTLSVPNTDVTYYNPNAGLPVRQFFSIGLQQRSDEEEWRRKRETAFTLNDLSQANQRAQQHSYETGIPIPTDAEGAGMQDMIDAWNAAATAEEAASAN